MSFITAKEARTLADEASNALWLNELIKIDKRIKEEAKSGASCVRADFFYRENYFYEVAKKAPMFFETLGFHTSNLVNGNGHFCFTISW